MEELSLNLSILGKTLDVLLSLENRWPERKDELQKTYVNLHTIRQLLIRESPRPYKYTEEDNRIGMEVAMIKQIEHDRLTKIKLKAQLEELGMYL
ncbi:unnamed protein product [marine sediment metagenome]|uniref:Uncharacterized protein n=1 Tax=marine sediment metagenome TaxID=412755 RepID=X1SDQ1_9ZZZZ